MCHLPWSVLVHLQPPHSLHLSSLGLEHQTTICHLCSTSFQRFLMAGVGDEPRRSQTAVGLAEDQIKSTCVFVFMIISGHGRTYHITGYLWGDPLVTNEFHSVDSPHMQSFDVFFVVSMNKFFNKQLSCPWYGCLNAHVISLWSWDFSAMILQFSIKQLWETAVKMFWNVYLLIEVGTCFNLIIFIQPSCVKVTIKCC